MPEPIPSHPSPIMEGELTGEGIGGEVLESAQVSGMLGVPQHPRRWRCPRRFPGEWAQMDQTLAQQLPHLRPAQRRGVALWVDGTLLDQSACQNAVVTALLAVGGWHALRQRRCEGLYDGPENAAPGQSPLDVALGFAPLLRWLLVWWQGAHLAPGH
jgi:hypothetical protein